MTLNQLRRQTDIDLPRSATDPAVAIIVARCCLDSRWVPMHAMRTRPANYPWGYFKMSQDRRMN